MRSFVLFCVLLLGVVLLTPQAPAEVFENADTAENRRDNTFGSRRRDDHAYIETDPETGDDSWGYVPREKEEERDWYDEVIITVSPNVDWPQGNGTGYTASTMTSNSTLEGQNGTTTTTTTTVNP